MKLSRLMITLCVIALVVYQSAVPAAFGETGEESFALPQGRVGDAYKFQIQTEGGLAPLKWRVVGGELPPGIELLATGALRGEPTDARKTPYVFAVEVSDSSVPPQRMVQQLAVSIQAAPLRMVLGAKPLKIAAPKDTRAIGPYIEATGKEIRLPEDGAPEANSSARSAEPPKNRRASAATAQSGERRKRGSKNRRASAAPEKSDDEEDEDGEEASSETASDEKPAPPAIKFPLFDGDTTIQIKAEKNAEVTVFIDGEEKKELSGTANDTGNLTRTLSAPEALHAGEVLTAKQETEAGESDESTGIKVEAAEGGDYSWGRTRAFFSGGVIFSKEREDFSKQDIFLALNVDKNWIWSPRFNFNTYIDVRLTSVPVNVKDTMPEPAEDGEPEEDKPDSLDTFIASRKAALMQLGAYAPLLLQKWSNKDGENALFVAPILKTGIQTITSELDKTGEAQSFGRDDVFNFGAFGFRFGHMNVSNSPDKAHEIVSYLDVTRGKWENFEVLLSDREIPDPSDPTKKVRETIRERRWRWGFEGRLKIPKLPLYVGFDANLGDGADDVRFLFGTRFDIGKVFSKLGLN